MVVDIASKPISSRKGQPGEGDRRGDEGKDTRLCFAKDEPPNRSGNGAVKENEADGMKVPGLEIAVWGSSDEAMVHLFSL